MFFYYGILIFKQMIYKLKPILNQFICHKIRQSAAFISSAVGAASISGLLSNIP